MKEKLQEWAEKYTPQFNELSEKQGKVIIRNLHINELIRSVELMIVGINPAGSDGVTRRDAVEFLQGKSVME